MAAIIQALKEEHRNIARLLDALSHQIEVFAEAGDPDYDIVLGVADYFIDYPDQCHHPKENLVYARLRHAHPQEAEGLFDLVAEHRQVHERVVRFHETIDLLLGQSDIARASIVAAARDFIALEREHMQKEEAQVLPLAERVLTAEDWAQIEAALAERRDPLFGDRAEQNFAALRERLLAWEAEFGRG